MSRQESLLIVIVVMSVLYIEVKPSKSQVKIQDHIPSLGENMVESQTLGSSHPPSGQIFTEQSSISSSESGAGFMKGLKSGLRLKSETLGSNVVNILLSLWTQTQSISQTGST